MRSPNVQSAHSTVVSFVSDSDSQACQLSCFCKLSSKTHTHTYNEINRVQRFRTHCTCQRERSSLSENIKHAFMTATRNKKNRFINVDENAWRANIYTYPKTIERRLWLKHHQYTQNNELGQDNKTIVSETPYLLQTKNNNIGQTQTTKIKNISNGQCSCFFRLAIFCNTY